MTVPSRTLIKEARVSSSTVVDIVCDVVLNGGGATGMEVRGETRVRTAPDVPVMVRHCDHWEGKYRSFVNMERRRQKR